MKLVKATQLDEATLAQVRQLVEQVTAHDGFAPKFYWYSTEHRRNEEFSDFLFYIQSECVAYLALYQFADDEVEVCVAVHPEFRRKGLFNRLWVDATVELHQRGIAKAIFNQHSHDQDNAPKSLAGIGARYFRSEYRYGCSTINQVNHAKPIKLRLADKHDAGTISRIDLACFGGEQDDLMARIDELLDEPGRSIYLAEDEQGNVVGKLHVLQREHAMLHDFCVLPKYHDQGYEQAILQQVTTQLLAEKNSAVMIETISDDYSSNKLYQSCGFKVVDHYRQWIFQLTEVYQHHSTVH